MEEATASSQEPLQENKILSPIKRKKLLREKINTYTVKRLIFGAMDPQKKEDLLKYLLRRTRKSTEDQIVNLFESFDKEYQKNKSNYHRNFLIKETFVLEQIEALRDEDRRKGKKLYFSNL